MWHVLAWKHDIMWNASTDTDTVLQPAAACGIYTIKPSCGRIPYGGVVASNIPAGVEGILSTQGPMTRSVDDLDLYMKIMCDAKPWLEDPS